MRKVLLGLAVAVFLTGCNNSSDDDGPLASALVIAATDYAGANVVYGQSLSEKGNPIGKLRSRALGDDPKLDPRLPALANQGNDELVLIRREWGSAVNNGTLVWLDPTDRYSFDGSLSAASTSANPQDYLRVRTDKAYVSRFEPAYDDVLIIDPVSRKRIGRIDLSGLADNPDGLARPTIMALYNGLVYLLLQDIDLVFGTYGNGKVAVINPATDKVVDVIDLNRKNPVVILPSPERGSLLVACAGDWAAPATSGLEEIDPATGVSTLIVGGENAALAGYLGDLVAFNNGLALVLNNKADWSGSYIQPVDLDTGAAGASLYFSWYIADLARDRFGRAIIADNITSQALAIDPETGAVAFTLDLAVPPQSLLDWRERD